MKNQALFSSKDKSKNLKCLLQFLFSALRVKLGLSLLRYEPDFPIALSRKAIYSCLFLLYHYYFPFAVLPYKLSFCERQRGWYCPQKVF